MNSDRLNETLAELRERMRTASMDEFDLMLDVQEALRKWGEEGKNGEMPFIEALRGWGIKGPDGEMGSVPTPAEVEGVLERLRALIIEDGPEREGVLEGYREVREWQRNGMRGALPQVERLVRWGVWPLEGTRGEGLPWGESYKQAQAKVVEAHSRRQSPFERLALLLEAREAVPDYPNIEMYLERAWDDVAQVAASEVANAMREARRQMERDTYQEALERLAQAQIQAAEQVPNPKADSVLHQRLQELAILRQKVAEAERRYEQMMRLLSEVDEAIKRFDEGDMRAIRRAGNLLEPLGDRELHRQEVRTRLAAVADRQADLSLWETGWAEYRQQNWSEAETGLRQVAESGLIETKRDEAARLAERALACQYAEQATQAELLSQWKSARSRYQQAMSLLESVGTDALTAPVYGECGEAIKRLEPLERSDQEVRRILAEARTLHELAQQRVASRTYLRQQVEPIPEFARAVTRLEQAAEKPSTLAREVHDLLEEIRQGWREAYLSAMAAALESNEIEILKKGGGLAEALRSANLLFDGQDEELARHLAVNALDKQYEQLQRALPVEWEQIEANRRARLAIHEARTTQVEEQYYQAVRERILAQVRQHQDPVAARAYLVQEVERLTLQADPQLVTTLIELCWKLEDWVEAERLATELAARAPALGDVWRGVTRATRWFKADLLSQGRTEIAALRERYKDDAQLLKVIESKERGEIDRLLGEAESAFARRTDDGYIEAAERYAQAAEWAADDPRVFIAFGELGDKLKPVIGRLGEQADAITIGYRSLADAVQEAEWLYRRLSSIDKVRDRLELEQKLNSAFKRIFQKLTATRNRWKAVHDLIEQANQARDEALEHAHSPTMGLSFVENWGVQAARHYLSQAREAAGFGDTECLDVVQKALDELAKLEGEGTLGYQVQLSFSAETVAIGGELEVMVELKPAALAEGMGYLFKVPRDEVNGSDLELSLSAPGFYFLQDPVANLPLLKARHREPQIARFRLIAWRPGTPQITVELHHGKGYEGQICEKINVAGIDENATLSRPLTLSPRPVAQPDYILQVQTHWNEDGSACSFHYDLRSTHASLFLTSGVRAQSGTLSKPQLDALRDWWQEVLSEMAGGASTDRRSRLVALGRYLYQTLWPEKLQQEWRALATVRHSASRMARTLLLVADQDACLPWELLCDRDKFLAERLIIGRWLCELNDLPPYEFPVGQVSVATYADALNEQEWWVDLIERPRGPQAEALPDGTLDGLAEIESLRGLHLLRYAQTAEQSDREAPVLVATAEGKHTIEDEIRPSKLNLRRNRPLVSLSYVSADRRELTNLTQQWASTFVLAGCSAFVGPLWTVPPAVEAAFISGFYHHLWTGGSLGEAFQTGRALARATNPQSLDWLAYVLFGDPMARPYRPVKGPGYATLEVIGQSIDKPLQAGILMRCRVSLRRMPPVWLKERVIEVEEALDYQNARVHLVVFGLQVEPNGPIELVHTPQGDYLGWFSMVASPDMVGEEVELQVHFADGEEPIQTLMLSFDVVNEVKESS